MINIKPTIFFRVDGNQLIGLGHLFRCVALSVSVKVDFQIVFVCKHIPRSVSTQLKENGFLLNCISNESDFFNLLSSPSIVVLDGYGFDSDYQREIKRIGCKLVCIDDLHDKEFFADLIINHAPGTLPIHYKAQSYTKFALGIEYALLRADFFKNTSLTRTFDLINKVFICFGGSDTENITLKVLSSVINFNFVTEIHIVCGSEFLYYDQIIEYQNQDFRLSVYKNLSAIQLSELMNKCQLAIVPASTISLEAFVCQMIILTGYTIDNQLGILDGLSKFDCVYSIGDFNKVELYEIEKQIEFFRNKTFHIQRNFNSNEKWLNIFKELI